MKKFITAVILLVAGCAPVLSQEQAMSMAPAELCMTEIETPVKYQAISIRKINCPKVVDATARKNAKNLPIGMLCQAWYERPIPYAVKAIEAEVRARKIDCAPIANAELNRQAAQRAAYVSALQQQQMMNQMNLQAQQQTNALQQMQFQQQMNSYRPTTTNCHAFGNNLNCTSY